jgi:hypothetical protein
MFPCGPYKHQTRVRTLLQHRKHIVNSWDEFAVFNSHKAKTSRKSERVTKVTNGTMLHCLSLFSFTFIYVYIATPKNLWSCWKQPASQPPAVPCFQFPPLYPPFRLQNLMGHTFLKTCLCESSCKQKVALRCASRIITRYFRSCIYLSHYPVFVSQQWRRKRLHSTSHARFKASVSCFYSFTYSIELVWAALSGKRCRWIC